MLLMTLFFTYRFYVDLRFIALYKCCILDDCLPLNNCQTKESWLGGSQEINPSSLQGSWQHSKFKLLSHVTFDIWHVDPDMKINQLFLITVISWSMFYAYFQCFIRWIQIIMRLLYILNLSPAEKWLRSATVISNLSERVMNLMNDHNSLMTSRFLSLIFVVLQMECAECEWTGELSRSWHSTLRLRVEDLTPGKLAEAEKKTEQSPAGRWGREGELKFFWSPQDRSDLSGVVSDLIVV